MDAFSQAATHLERTLGCPVRFSTATKSNLVGLPLFLSERYSLRLWTWQGRQFVIVSPNEAVVANSPTPSELAGDLRRIADALHMPSILVLASLSQYQRTRLITERAAFIVPGRQLFIPPFMDLVDSFRCAKTAEKLSGTAQFILLFQLLAKPGPLRLKDWAKASGRSPVMASKAYAELVAHGLCESVQMRRNRNGIVFTASGEALWQKALPHLRSPVIKRLWIELRRGVRPEHVLDAGLTALEKSTMLSDNSIPTGAIGLEEFKSVVAPRIHVCEDSDMADLRLECWAYEPAKLSKDGKTVDPLSLWLSLSNMNDERVEEAREQLLKEFKW